MAQRCVQLNDGIILRTTVSNAEKLVTAGQGIYVPKSMWRKHRAENPVSDNPPTEDSEENNDPNTAEV